MVKLKFNSGYGALLCENCGVIIATSTRIPKQYKRTNWFIKEYSFNIESRLYLSLTPEYQKLWLTDIQHAVKSGIEYGIELANDEHYK